MPYDTGMSYRKTAIEGASSIGLVIVLYDTLWGDLRRAAEAFRRDDIEARCKELSHAFVVLAQLEDWVSTEKGGDLAASLVQFYNYLRFGMLHASTMKSAENIEELMELILQVRSAWQQRDMTGSAVAGTSAEQPPGKPAIPEPQRIGLSLSA